jgi:hypothetical protein
VTTAASRSIQPTARPSGRPTSTSGADGVTDVWRTHIASFQAAADPGANYYTLSVNGGELLNIAVTVPDKGGKRWREFSF